MASMLADVLADTELRLADLEDERKIAEAAAKEISEALPVCVCV